MKGLTIKSTGVMIIASLLGTFTAFASSKAQSTKDSNAYLQNEVKLASSFKVHAPQQITTNGVGLGDSFLSLKHRWGMPSKVIQPWNSHSGTGAFTFNPTGYSPSTVVDVYFWGGRAIKLVQTFKPFESGEIMSVMSNLWPGAYASSTLSKLFPAKLFHDKRDRIVPGLYSVYIQQSKQQAVFTVELGDRPPVKISGATTQLYFEEPTRHS